MFESSINEQFKWIEEYSVEEDQETLSVNKIIPAKFDKYFVIESNYGIIDNFPFDKYPENAHSIDDLNTQHDIKRDFGLYLNKDTEHLYRPVSIKYIAGRFGVTYSRHALDEIKCTPGISPLYEKSILSYTSLLGEVWSSNIYLYIKDYYRLAFLNNIEIRQKSIMGDIDAYIDFVKKTQFDCCSYLFPNDHSWCLVTYEYVPNLIFACNDTIAEKVKLIEALELFEVHPEDLLYSF